MELPDNACVTDRRLAPAVAFAMAHETPWRREPDPAGLAWGIHGADPAPWNRLLGPVSPRGPTSGLILRAGRELARWGEPRRPDLTFSVAKTYLALLAGVAHGRGLLPDPDEPVRRRVPAGIGFDGEHNSQVTWTHLLQQTSEWEGECLGLPDTVDRYRRLAFQPPAPGPAGRKGDPRPLQTPGSFWEYNDVRINQLALALLHLFGEPLPEVFEQSIMAPIGASQDWRWQPYDHGWVEVRGRRMPSVPGGSHWGGGVSIGCEDQALIAQLMLQHGRWQGRALLPGDWFERMCAPCAIAPFYGYLLWLNGTREVFPSAPATSVFAIGAGSSFTWVDPALELVAIVRWFDSTHADALFGAIVAALI
jgi:CubicO group peptidase (beta-lactamase class C family)